MEGMAFAATVFGSKPTKPVYELVRTLNRPNTGNVAHAAGSFALPANMSLPCLPCAPVHSCGNQLMYEVYDVCGWHT